ncbi:glycosyltransferase family 9 protein [Alloalcanivorax profundimaris]|uniref:glycosyltransferase family 9 protein n=1 Tax=Alloalcanivorax profundimaris TaxID=2735259 RepID=UPI001887EF13|nr:glycosyltransferase family 9 protein [Alloalcanivorax profundimaris]MBF1801807.1 glycosyltransferase family 9 protein [Alloalcanivorax profundimaris]
MSDRPNKALFVCTHGIGDFVMMLPVLSYLQYKEVKLVLIVKDLASVEIAKYFLDQSQLECFSLSGQKETLIRRAFRLWRWVKRKKPGVVFSQYGVNTALYSLLSIFLLVPQRIGWKGRLSFLNTYNFRATKEHKVIENCKVLQWFGYDIDDALFSWDKKKRSYRLESAGALKRVAIAPGSGQIEKHKRWSPEKYSNLIHEINKNFNLPVYVVGGPEEAALGEEIASYNDRSNVVNIAGSMGIPQTLDFLAGCDVVVSNCNGVSHMAGAVGTKVIGLYGPTDPMHTGVYSRDLIVVSSNMECSPCYRRGFITGCGNPVCMDSISVDMVLSEISRVGGMK